MGVRCLEDVFNFSSNNMKRKKEEIKGVSTWMGRGVRKKLERDKQRWGKKRGKPQGVWAWKPRENREPGRAG